MTISLKFIFLIGMKKTKGSIGLKTLPCSNTPTPGNLLADNIKACFILAGFITFPRCRTPTMKLIFNLSLGTNKDIYVKILK